MAATKRRKAVSVKELLAVALEAVQVLERRVGKLERAAQRRQQAIGFVIGDRHPQDEDDAEVEEMP